MKRNELVSDFIKRVFSGSLSEYITFMLYADDILPVKGDKEHLLKWLENHPLYMGDFQIVDFNHVIINAIFNAC